AAAAGSGACAASHARTSATGASNGQRGASTLPSCTISRAIQASSTSAGSAAPPAAATAASAASRSGVRSSPAPRTRSTTAARVPVRGSGGDGPQARRAGQRAGPGAARGLRSDAPPAVSPSPAPTFTIAFVLPYGEPDEGFFPDTVLAQLCADARAAGCRADL